MRSGPPHENHEVQISGFALAPGRRDLHNASRGPRRPSSVTNQNSAKRTCAMWTKPEFTEMRFGFEVTMYIYNR
jgi:pyrroloquinoline quinone biosynthesis protein A